MTFQARLYSNNGRNQIVTGHACCGWEIMNNRSRGAHQPGVQVARRWCNMYSTPANSTVVDLTSPSLHSSIFHALHPAARDVMTRRHAGMHAVLRALMSVAGHLEARPLQSNYCEVIATGVIQFTNDVAPCSAGNDNYATIANSLINGSRYSISFYFIVTTGVLLRSGAWRIIHSATLTTWQQPVNIRAKHLAVHGAAIPPHQKWHRHECVHGHFSVSFALSMNTYGALKVLVFANLNATAHLKILVPLRHRNLLCIVLQHHFWRATTLAILLRRKITAIIRIKATLYAGILNIQAYV